MAYIIGFTGYAGAGKNTLADMLAEELRNLGIEFEIISFADPIHSISEQLGLSPFNRKTKEVYSEASYSSFEESLIAAINDNLGDIVAEDDLADLFSYTIEELKTQGYLIGNTLKISPRRLCQVVGTDGGRSVRKTFWKDILVSQTEGSQDDVVPTAFVVTDVRFPNEATVPDKLIYVERDSAVPVEAHESERHIQFIAEKFAHGAVANNGTLDDLRECAVEIAKSVIKEDFGDS